MKFTRSLLVSMAFVLIAIGVAVWLYPRLPAQVPRHWDLAGNVNGYMSRFWAAAFPALSVLAMAVLTWLLPVISPRKFRIESFMKVFVGLMLVIQAFALVIGLGLLLGAAGFAVSAEKIAMLATGALLMVLGNYMGKLRRNFFIGIRTPWTIASEATWERTHRFGGWSFMLAGVLVLVSAALDAPIWVPVACVAAAALIPVGYSYVIYQHLEAASDD